MKGDVPMSTRKLLGFVIAVGLLLTQFVSPVSGSVQGDQFVPESGGAGPQTAAIVISDVALDAKNPVVAYNSTRDQYLVVWYNDRPGNDDIQAQRLDKNGKLLGGKFFISAGPDHDRRFPDVAYDSKNDQYLVVWEDYDAGSMVPGYGIHGRRVSGTGLVIDNTDIVIRSKGSIYSAQEPAVEYAYSSSTFLVVWTETFHPSPLQKDILGQIIGVNGALQGGQITISDDTGNGDYRQAPDIAYDRIDNRFLVVFEQRYSTFNIWGISGQLVTGGGALWQSNFIIEYASADARSPSVAAFSKNPSEYKFVVTYTLLYAPGTDILRIVVKNNGDLDLSSKAYVTATDMNETNPAIATNESNANYLITWSQPDPQGPTPYVNISGHKYAHQGHTIVENTYLSGEFSDHSAIAAGIMGDYMIVHQEEHFGFHILGVLYRQVDWQIFQDVGSFHWAFSWINRLYAAGVTSGCSQSPLKYCPEQTVTRAEMAKFLLKGVHGPSYEPPPVAGNTGFADVSPSYWAATWIKQLAAEGITSGCGGGNYCPNAQVKRAEMAKFLLAAKHGVGYNPPPVGGSTGFNDVSTGYWAAAWIKQLSAEGITSGCGGGNYCPDGQVTRAEMAKFLINTFSLP